MRGDMSDGIIQKRGKAVRWQIVSLAFALGVCALNNALLIPSTASASFGWLLSSYLNDVMAPVAIFSICNIIYACQGRQLTSLPTMLMTTLVWAFVWEVVGPMVREQSVADLFDVVAYIMGTLAYWLLQKHLHAFEAIA